MIEVVIKVHDSPNKRVFFVIEEEEVLFKRVIKSLYIL